MSNNDFSLNEVTTIALVINTPGIESYTTSLTLSTRYEKEVDIVSAIIMLVFCKAHWGYDLLSLLNEKPLNDCNCPEGVNRLNLKFFGHVMVPLVFFVQTFSKPKDWLLFILIWTVLVFTNQVLGILLLIVGYIHVIAVIVALSFHRFSILSMLLGPLN